MIKRASSLQMFWTYASLLGRCPAVASRLNCLDVNAECCSFAECCVARRPQARDKTCVQPADVLDVHKLGRCPAVASL